jgi:hypothetical protein
LSYKAIVAQLTNLRKFEKADFLQVATVAGHQVVVGIDQKEGDLGVFFPTDGQLSHEMCVYNDLYTESAMNDLAIPPERRAKPGFFDLKRRVRAQRFRGEKSDGYWTTLDSLAWTGYDVSLLKAGDVFTELNEKQICNKYFSPATIRAMKAGQQKAVPDVTFPKHVDTEQFRYFVGNIRPARFSGSQRRFTALAAVMATSSSALEKVIGSEEAGTIDVE